MLFLFHMQLCIGYINCLPSEGRINNMQVLARTEYQDVYRVTDGVLLIVNKFEYMFDQLSPVDYSG